jgi:hypothetical protein
LLDVSLALTVVSCRICRISQLGEQIEELGRLADAMIDQIGVDQIEVRELILGIVADVLRHIRVQHLAVDLAKLPRLPWPKPGLKSTGRTETRGTCRGHNVRARDSFLQRTSAGRDGLATALQASGPQTRQVHSSTFSRLAPFIGSLEYSDHCISKVRTRNTFLSFLSANTWKDLRVEETAAPKICGPRQVVVRVAWCGICGTAPSEAQC